MLFGLLLLANTVQAQFSISGLELGKTYTYDEIKEAIESRTAADIISQIDSCGHRTLRFGSDYFVFDSDWHFRGFFIESRQFEVKAHTVLFGVEDAIPLLAYIKNSRLEWKQPRLFYLYLEEVDKPVRIHYKNNRIEMISFSY